MHRTLRWSAARSYRGWNKHDGLSSPILRAVLGWGTWPRLMETQAVISFPAKLRPWLLVCKVHNPNGLTIVVPAWLERYRIDSGATHLAEAERLLALLLEIRSPGACGGVC